jgi:uncharacterized membrane-anchored protein YhcB (DUF1043 family)
VRILLAAQDAPHEDAMDQQTLLIVMTVFVVVAALAMVVQVVFLFGIYKAARGMNEKAERVMPKLEALIETSRRTIEESRKQITEITTRTTEILDTTKQQLVRVDELFADASSRLRIQMDRAELVLDDAMTRAQSTIALVHSGVVKPIHQIQALAAGVRTAISFFAKGRPNPTNATADEEMFI